MYWKNLFVVMMLPAAIACVKPREPTVVPNAVAWSDTLAQPEMEQSIKLTISQTDGCKEAAPQLATLKEKYGESPNYYYFQGYCSSEANPEKACEYFGAFLTVAKGDPRNARAKAYIQSQDEKKYPSCVQTTPSTSLDKEAPLLSDRR